MNTIKDYYYDLDKLNIAKQHLSDRYSSFIGSNQYGTVYRGMAAYMSYIQENIADLSFIVSLDNELISKLKDKRDKYFFEQSMVSLWGSWRLLWLIHFSINFDKVGVSKQIDQVSRPNYLQFRSRLMQVIDESFKDEGQKDVMLINLFEDFKDWDPINIERFKDDFNSLHVFLIQEIEKQILYIEHEKVPVVMYKDPENKNRYYLQNKINKNTYHGLIERDSRPVPTYSILSNLAEQKTLGYDFVVKIYKKKTSSALNEIFAKTKLNEKIDRQLKIGVLLNDEPFDFIVKNVEKGCIEINKKVIFEELD